MGPPSEAYAAAPPVLCRSAPALASLAQMARGACLALLVVLCAALAAAQHAHYVDGKHNPLYEHAAGEEGHGHAHRGEDEIVRARIESCSG